MQTLEAGREGRRDDYPIRAVWNSVLKGIVFQHESVESLRRELHRNAVALPQKTEIKSQEGISGPLACCAAMQSNLFRIRLFTGKEGGKPEYLPAVAEMAMLSRGGKKGSGLSVSEVWS